MSKLQTIVERLNKALNEPVDEAELQDAILAVREKLSEPKWAIEDEKLRGEMEKLIVYHAVREYADAANCYNRRVRNICTNKQQQRRN